MLFRRGKNSMPACYEIFMALIRQELAIQNISSGARRQRFSTPAAKYIHRMHGATSCICQNQMGSSSKGPVSCSCPRHGYSTMARSRTKKSTFVSLWLGLSIEAIIRSTLPECILTKLDIQNGRLPALRAAEICMELEARGVAIDSSLRYFEDRRL
jgi:hypothetical protein